MGGKQSKLKKEIEALKADAAAAVTKHTHDVETLRNEKRMLEFKLQALQEMTAKAQVEADKATQLAMDSEEKVKALKWELVRRVSVPTDKRTPVSPASSVSSLTASTASSSSDMSTSLIPRVPVSWKLKEGVALRRSNTSLLPKTNSNPKREFSAVLTPPMSSTPLEAPMHRVPLVKPQGKTHDHTDARTSSNDCLPRNQNEVITGQTLKPATTSSITAPVTAVASSVAGFDKFAPVKRRSSTNDPLVTMAAEAKQNASEKVESYKKVKGESSRHMLVKDSDSEREHSSSRRSEASSGSDEQEAEVSRGRGVRAATRGLSTHVNKVDDVLALSDDEED